MNKLLMRFIFLLVMVSSSGCAFNDHDVPKKENLSKKIQIAANYVNSRGKDLSDYYAIESNPDAEGIVIVTFYPKAKRNSYISGGNEIGIRVYKDDQCSPIYH